MAKDSLPFTPGKVTSEFVPTQSFIPTQPIAPVFTPSQTPPTWNLNRAPGQMPAYGEFQATNMPIGYSQMKMPTREFTPNTSLNTNASPFGPSSMKISSEFKPTFTPTTAPVLAPTPAPAPAPAPAPVKNPAAEALEKLMKQVFADAENKEEEQEVTKSVI